MKKITLLFVLLLLVANFSFSQNTCSTASPVTPGITSVGAINGTAPALICDADDPATFGEWYSYTASGNGYINITTDLPANAGGDTNLMVYSGSCGALVCEAYSDDIDVLGNNFLSEVLFEITSGTTYYIAFDDRWDDAGFDFQINEYIPTCDPSIITLPYSNDFNELFEVDICWNTLDNDGDGHGWFDVDYDLNNDGNPDGNPCIGSASWDSTDGALFPDNWIISNAIDLTGFSTSDLIEMTWKARGIDPDFPDENYTVYVATGDQTSDFLSSPVSFNEIIGQNGGAGQTFVDRSLDMSSLAGQMVYFAFRHHNVSDQFVLNIDDIAITATLSVDEFNNNTVKIVTNDKVISLFNLPNATEYSLYSVNGKRVAKGTITNQSSYNIDVKSISSGVYIIELVDSDTKDILRKKIVL